MLKEPYFQQQATSLVLISPNTFTFKANKLYMLVIKKFLVFFLSVAAIVFSLQSCGPEDKSKRRDPVTTASDTTTSGNVITVTYSKVSLKGRTLGKDVARYDTVWQTGADEATTFEITKPATIEGKPLAAGKYSLFTIPGKKTWTIIFNKTWEQWGAEYKQKDDVLRVQVPAQEAPEYGEMLRFVVEKSGRVLMFWGDTMVIFQVS